jgi:SAM-dependent methyltransferase
MRSDFVERVLSDLMRDGVLTRSTSVLAICAGLPERDTFAKLGFANVVISGLDHRVNEEDLHPFAWRREDAQDLTLEDDSFDFAFVSDGLHHCSAPHRAMLEMYRVAKRGIIVFESRDSVLMRLACRIGLSSEYELEAVVSDDFSRGGVNNSGIPNFVYRWTEAEFEKTIRSFNPRGQHDFRFFYALNLPYGRTRMSKAEWKMHALHASKPVLKPLGRIFKKQCNSFAMVALKPRIPDDLWPWLKLADDNLVLDPEYAKKHFSAGSGPQSTMSSS